MWDTYFNMLSDKERRIVDEKIMNYIRFYPYDSEPLESPLQGLRSYNKIGSGNRVYFAICAECRKMGFPRVNNCMDCSSLGDDTVKLFAAGSHDLYDELGRERRKRLRFRGRK